MAVTANRHYLNRQTLPKYLVESYKLTEFLYKLVGSQQRPIDLRFEDNFVGAELWAKESTVLRRRNFAPGFRPGA